MVLTFLQYLSERHPLLRSFFHLGREPCTTSRTSLFGSFPFTFIECAVTRETLLSTVVVVFFFFVLCLVDIFGLFVVALLGIVLNDR